MEKLSKQLQTLRPRSVAVCNDDLHREALLSADLQVYLGMLLFHSSLGSGKCYRRRSQMFFITCIAILSASSI